MDKEVALYWETSLLGASIMTTTEELDMVWRFLVHVVSMDPSLTLIE